MAWKTIELTEEEQKAGGGRQWKKFEAIGDSALGFFVKKETATANYSDGAKQVTKWIFYGKCTDQHGVAANREFEITPPMDLEKKLKKAEREMGLAEGLGHLVKMTFTSTLAIEGRDDPKKIFTVAVDTDFKPQNPLPASVTWFRQRGAEKSPEKPPYNPDDDIPF